VHNVLTPYGAARSDSWRPGVVSTVDLLGRIAPPLSVVIRRLL